MIGSEIDRNHGPGCSWLYRRNPAGPRGVDREMPTRTNLVSSITERQLDVKIDTAARTMNASCMDVEIYHPGPVTTTKSDAFTEG
jgi:hypothetical protein